tara:strand:+ start:636 stop:1181 length:546 start_codon:yes stop_codon:yes gene_type:complete
MKIKEPTLRRIIKEEIMNEVGLDTTLGASGASQSAQRAASPKTPEKLEIKSIGDLKKAIKAATLKKQGKLAKGGAKEGIAGLFLDMVPFGGLVKDLGQAAIQAYKLPDSAETKTGLDALNVDDNVSKIVADEVENAFLKSMAKKLEAMPDDTPLAQVNMTQMLSQFISQKFNNRTVAGFDK